MPPRDYYYGTAYNMEKNGYTIERGFVKEWDKDFAHPTQPWTLPQSEANGFEVHA